MKMRKCNNINKKVIKEFYLSWVLLEKTRTYSISPYYTFITTYIK